MPNLVPKPDGAIRRGGASRFVLVGVVAALFAACGGSAALDADAVAKEVEAVESLAAEGALLAAGAREERTTAAFTRVHADELARTASEQAEKLNTSAVAPGLEPPAREAANLASEVADLLARLAASPADREAARAIGAELEEAARAAKRLAEGV